MPYSHNAFDQTLKQHISQILPESILDVGAGAGKLSTLVDQCYKGNYKIDCIEPVPKYVDEFELSKKYNRIYLLDTKDYMRHFSSNRYDLVYFGDVLEHCFLSEAIDILDFFSYRSKWIILAWPTNAIQDDWEGQKSEIHKSNFTIADLTRFDIQYYNKKFLEWLPSNPSSYQSVEYHYAVIKGIICNRSDSI